MTNLRKSDSQLDAEAAVRQMLARGRSHDALTEWRAAAHHEARYRLHDSAESALGPELANWMVRYIAGGRGENPVHDALLQFERTCRRRHRDWWDHPNGRPTCYEITRAVIYGTSVQWAADQAGISFPRAERLLIAAGDYMRRQQERWLADTEMSAGHDPEYCRVCRGEAA